MNATSICETKACGWIVKSTTALLLLSLPLILGEHQTAEAIPRRTPIALGSSLSFETGLTIRARRLPPNAETLAFSGLWFDEGPSEPFGFEGRGLGIRLAQKAGLSEAYEVFHEVSRFGDTRLVSTLPNHRTKPISSSRLDGIFDTPLWDLRRPSQPDLLSQSSDPEWGYLLPIVRFDVENQSRQSVQHLRFPPIYADALAISLGNLLIGGIDYVDPLAVGVPLLQVSGYQNLNISPHFQVRDFSTHDGAPYARISPNLVMGLERVFENSGPIRIISGYRHKRYNASVKGASESRHMAGQAADIWSPTKSSLYLARRVVDAMGCGIGLGLGRNTIHVDVRGTLATWTYPGAPLSEQAFDNWIRMLCSGQSSTLPILAAQIDWLIGDSTEVQDYWDTKDWDPDTWIRHMQRELAEFASNAWFREGPGLVVINMTRGVPSLERGINDFVRYARVRSEEVSDLELSSMIDRVASHDPLRYFVYVVYLADGSVLTGLSNLDTSIDRSESDYAVSSPLSPSPEREREIVSGSERAPANVSLQQTQPTTDLAEQPGWTIVVASTADPLEAENQAERFGGLLGRFDLEVRYSVHTVDNVPRYRITAGHFQTASAARDVLRRIREFVPNDAWLLPINP